MTKHSAEVRTRLKLFLLVFLMSTVSIICFAQFGGGQGTAADPWQINRDVHLSNVRDHLTGHFIQTTNIDLGAAPWNEGAGWVPIGNNENRFTGTYNGNEFVITGLTINNDNQTFQGLFGYANGATLNNITLLDVNLRFGGNSGSLVGRADNTNINHCSATGTVVGTGQNVGGLIGYYSGMINDSYSRVTVNSPNAERVGGLIGDSWGRGNRCWASGNVTGRNSVGGFAGRDYNNHPAYQQCFATGRVVGNNEVGGFAGLMQTATYWDLYATGDVVGVNMVGGFVGNSAFVARINRAYSIGRVTGETNVGGFIGFLHATNPGEANSCYWNTETSGQAQSPGGGEARDGRHMVFPYEANTYVGWDFNQIWAHDEDRSLNGGYPVFQWHPTMLSPNPDVASNPQPAHQAVNISLDLERVSWSYIESELFTNPLGFRVYMNTTGQFGNDDDFAWVAYVEEQENYATSEILPEEFDYYTTYYWKVIPTTIDPDERRYDRVRRVDINPRDEQRKSRGDAENCPVWSFTTVPLPYPTVAVNPIPADDTVNVSVNLQSLRWSYLGDAGNVNPLGFRVYFGTTEEFGEDDPFSWVPYVENQDEYSTGEILPEELEHLTFYYWQVIPTTTDPDRGRNGLRPTRVTSDRAVRDYSLIRGDAENCPVWSFKTERFPNPVAAVNPAPENEAIDVSIELERLSWSYIEDLSYANPLGFRVYFGTSEEFGEDDPFIWVPYVANQENYATGEILPEELSFLTDYYWQVIPTTINPDGRSEEGARRRTESGNRSILDLSSKRGDAEDCPVWTFRTGISGKPLQAVNPQPAHLAEGISLGLDRISWDYDADEAYTIPVGFRVYMNTTGAFGVNAPYVWVDYIEDQVTFSCTEIIPDELDPSTTYFWRVIPTTIYPDERQEDSLRLRAESGKRSSRDLTSHRGDAENCPVWRFTTGFTGIDDEKNLPLVTQLKGNYPNPFNPETTLSFSLAQDGEVVIEIYNSRGQRIITLIDDYLPAGEHKIRWYGRDSYNNELSSGVYLIKMKTGEQILTDKMIMAK